MQIFALLFLVLGCGFGALTGYRFKAVGDGSMADATVLTSDPNVPGVFNWLLFSIGFGAGLVACSVLLAASLLAPTEE